MTEGRCERKMIGSVELKVDGKTIPMKGFVQDFVGHAIVGMLSALKGIDKPREIELKLTLR